MIQERRPNFDGVSHADAIDFGQNVIGEEIFLIEPQKRRSLSAAASLPLKTPSIPFSEAGRGICSKDRFSTSEKVPFQ